jgi:hypothetical protein
MGSQELQSLAPAPAAVDAIRSDDMDALKQALETDRDLVRTTVDGQRTLLHVATDWPGHFPNNAASVTEPILSGADVNATFIGRHSETPRCDARSGRRHECILVRMSWRAAGDRRIPAGAWRRFELAWT